MEPWGSNVLSVVRHNSGRPLAWFLLVSLVSVLVFSVYEYDHLSYEERGSSPLATVQSMAWQRHHLPAHDACPFKAEQGGWWVCAPVDCASARGSIVSVTLHSDDTSFERAMHGCTVHALRSNSGWPWTSAAPGLHVTRSQV